MYVIKPIRNNKGNIFARKVRCVFGKKTYGVWRYVFIKEKVIFFPTLKNQTTKNQTNKTVSEWGRGEKNIGQIHIFYITQLEINFMFYNSLEFNTLVNTLRNSENRSLGWQLDSWNLGKSEGRDKKDQRGKCAQGQKT